MKSNPRARLRFVLPIHKLITLETKTYSENVKRAKLQARTYRRLRSTDCGKPQVMVEAAYRHHNLDWRYLTIEVGPDDLEDAVKGAKAMGFQGFNCTIPHKVKVIDYLDGLGESASLMGAVNCVVRKDGKWIGENTDGKGFVSSLKELTDPKDKSVVIFGAGGAARAIGVEVALAGASAITIVNRSAGRGKNLLPSWTTSSLFRPISCLGTKPSSSPPEPAFDQRHLDRTFSRR